MAKLSPSALCHKDGAPPPPPEESGKEALVELSRFLARGMQVLMVVGSCKGC